MQPGKEPDYAQNRQIDMKRLCLGVVLAVAVVACGTGEVALDRSSWPRPDGSWQLSAGVSLVDGYPITMSIDGTEVTGRAACNAYGGTVTVNGSSISVGELGQTAMGCETEVMAAETAFLTVLGLVTHFEYAEGGLVLSSPEGDLVFSEAVAVPIVELVGTTWVLETLIEDETASPVAGDRATLRLAADGRLTGSTGCRALIGRWLEKGGVVIVPELSAEGDCPDDLWKQDSLVVSVVGDEFRADVAGAKLTLTSMGGDGLVYRAEG